MSYRGERSGITRRQLIVAAPALLGQGLASAQTPPPSIQFTRIPQADINGSEKHDIIEGAVTGARDGQRIVLYSKNGSWWLQPLLEAPFTRILPNAKWRNATHLGSDYAALLVDPGYRPDRNIKALPPAGGLVAAVSVTKGAASSPSPTLQFSGYEWRLRNATSNRGGRTSPYSPDNAWTDAKGALHLRIKKNGERFECAEVALTRSFGYGTYSFLVRDVSKVAPAVTFEMFTWDYSGTDQNNREMDIAIRGKPLASMGHGTFILQPYQLASNFYEFNLPPAAYLHSIHWEAGRVEFVTSSADSQKRIIAQRSFTQGVPTPGLESARMALYLQSSATGKPAEAEVIVDRFEYTP